jgi:hypothetical protein
MRDVLVSVCAECVYDEAFTVLTYKEVEALQWELARKSQR